MLQVLGIVCGLAVAAFVTLEPRRTRSAVVFAAALIAASVAIGPGRVPDPVWTGVLLAAGAGFALWNRSKKVSDTNFRKKVSDTIFLGAVACGGAAAAAWVAVLGAEGLPMPLAYALVAAVAAASNELARRRPAFAPASLREEALVLVGVLALMLATAPAIVGGWDSAAALRAAALDPPPAESAAWAFVLAVGAAVFGAIHSLWRGR